MASKKQGKPGIKTIQVNAPLEIHNYAGSNAGNWASCKADSSDEARAILARKLQVNGDSLTIKQIKNG